MIAAGIVYAFMESTFEEGHPYGSLLGFDLQLVGDGNEVPLPELLQTAERALLRYFSRGSPTPSHLRKKHLFRGFEYLRHLRSGSGRVEFSNVGIHRGGRNIFIPAENRRKITPSQLRAVQAAMERAVGSPHFGWNRK